jgi:hypothetical protein
MILLMEVPRKYGGYALKVIVMTLVFTLEQEKERMGVLIVQDRRLLTMTFGSNREK